MYKVVSEAQSPDVVIEPRRINDYLQRKSVITGTILSAVGPASGHIISALYHVALKHSDNQKDAFPSLYRSITKLLARAVPSTTAPCHLAADLIPILAQARVCGLFLNEIDVEAVTDRSSIAYPSIVFDFILEKVHQRMAAKLGPCPYILLRVHSGNIPDTFRTAAVYNVDRLDIADAEVARECFEAYWSEFQEQIRLIFGG